MADGHGALHYHTVRVVLVACLAALVAALALPARAQAHGAVDPEASVDLARLTHVPHGVRVRVVDGDLRLWLSAPAGRRVTVLDYSGAPYLWFGPWGVRVNENSEMFYLNLIPPVIPDVSLTRTTHPDWHLATHAHAYEWHDGRVAALASALAAPDARVLGRWSVPLRVDGRAAAVTGQLDHRPRPSVAWLIPAAAVLMLLPALLRLHDRRLERTCARLVGAITLAGVAVASVGAGLHGRPGLSGSLLAIMAAELGLGLVAAACLVRGRHELPAGAIIASLAVYRSLAGIAVLWRGYVLLAVPPTLARAAISICLAGGIAVAVQTIITVDGIRPRPDRGSAAGS